LWGDSSIEDYSIGEIANYADTGGSNKRLIFLKTPVKLAKSNDL
jgi:hypothetical protein